MNNQLSTIENKLRNDEWYRILFLGDSITSTEWVHPNWREIMEYVVKDKLEEQMGEWELPCWKVRCYNAGYNGVRSREMVDFIEEDVVLHRSNLVIFMDTYNDIYRQIGPEDHEKNLENIFDRLKSIAENVVFTTSVPGIDKEANTAVLPYIEAANRAVAKHENIKTIDLFKAFEAYDLFQFFTFISENGNEDAGIEPGELDTSHPNQLGNAVIAKHLLKEIFDIDFDPDTYIRETLSGQKNPKY